MPNETQWFHFATKYSKHALFGNKIALNVKMLQIIRISLANRLLRPTL